MNIVTALNEGRVTFTYRKADGTTRQATGTTKTDLIPESVRGKTNPNTETSATVRYYDLDRNAWRSFTRAALNENSVQAEAAAA
jgi:hypothetical protein